LLVCRAGDGSRNSPESSSSPRRRTRLRPRRADHGESDFVDPAESSDGELGNAALPHDLSPWGSFLGADPAVKAVLIGLASASVATWTVWLAKTIELIQARRKAQSDPGRRLRRRCHPAGGAPQAPVRRGPACFQRRSRRSCRAVSRRVRALRHSTRNRSRWCSGQNLSPRLRPRYRAARSKSWCLWDSASSDVRI
jgi:hypothetical protein